jgi:vancomycin permeability regulator SanA
MILVVCVGIVAAFLLINGVMVETTMSSTYTLSDSIPSKQVVLVLGTRVYAKTVQPVLQGRLDVALLLYRRGLVSKFLVSGDHGSKYYDEANTMREYLLTKGVPSQDIFMDHAGFSTLDSLYRARDVFRVKSLIIATQSFHIPRSLYIARHLGIDAIGVPADESSVSDAVAFRNAIREPFARVKAWWDMFVGTPPTVLGSPIPIDGSGEGTRD